MERLTRKTNGKDYCSYCHQVEFDNEILERKDNIIEPQDFYNKYPYQPIGNEEEILNKLGAIEDLEEELGIDLITLFKAISNEKGIWKKVYGTKDFVNTRAMLTCEFGKWRIYDKEWIYELKDYGKTWWLEKPEEELEND